MPVHRFFLRLYRFRCGLAAFLIPLLVRVVPEVIMGPYPVGFDTTAFYVLNALDPESGKVGCWRRWEQCRFRMSMMPQP